MPHVYFLGWPWLRSASVATTDSEDDAEQANYIERLPVLYREVARKRLMYDMQYKEIAEEMDLELNTVKTRLRRAKALMEEMRRQDKEEEDNER